MRDNGHDRLIRVGAAVLAGFLLLAGGVVPGQAQTAPAQTPTPGYLLGPGDTLEIMVLGEADLSRTVIIRPDGKISLPLLGDVPVAGLTPPQVAELLTALLRTYLKRPVVTVTVTSPRGAFVYLTGPGIASPGSFTLQTGWTVMEAITAAGGVTPRAALKKAVLIRRGAPEPIPLDLERLLVKADQTANATLEPGDVIMVPLLEFRVLVLGLVRSPGIFDVDESVRLLDVLLRAGGPLERAAIDAIGVIRQGADGKPQVTTFNLVKVLRGGDLSQNPVLRHGDIVYVPEVNRINWRDVLAWIVGVRSLYPGFLLFGP